MMTDLIEDPSQMSYSWWDMAHLTHATQVERYNWCACEEQEQFPYEDCPRLKTKHMMGMTTQELAQIVCMGYEGRQCTNRMDEYGCRNSMKDNEAFCSECCEDVNEGACCG